MIERNKGVTEFPRKVPNKESQVEAYSEPDLDVSSEPKVLMYHRIVDDKSLSNQQDTCLHVDDFERHLTLLNQFGYTPITFRDYKLSSEGKLRLPKKPVILTFDDGYEDVYRLAYPLLKEQGMKAVIFVLGDRSIRYNSWDANSPGISKARLMNDRQIKELHSQGFEIGAHTLSHSDLLTMEYSERYNEVYKSKLILEALLNSKIISFSYPYGLVNTEIKDLVEEAGYQFGCSVFSGPAEFGDDLHEIRRIAIHNSTTAWGFLMRLVAPYEYVEWMWWKANHAIGNGHQEHGNGKVA